MAHLRLRFQPRYSDSALPPLHSRMTAWETHSPGLNPILGKESLNFPPQPQPPYPALPLTLQEKQLARHLPALAAQSWPPRDSPPSGRSVRRLPDAKSRARMNLLCRSLNQPTVNQPALNQPALNQPTLKQPKCSASGIFAHSDAAKNSRHPPKHCLEPFQFANPPKNLLAEPPQLPPEAMPIKRSDPLLPNWFVTEAVRWFLRRALPPEQQPLPHSNSKEFALLAHRSAPSSLRRCQPPIFSHSSS